MIKTDFYSKYRISDAKPTDVARHTIKASDFGEITASFLNSNFRGLCTVNNGISEGKNVYITVSEEGAAYFFKIMLSYIKARQSVDINIALGEDELLVKISSEEHLPFDEADGLELVRLARRAGFSVNISNELLVLRAAAKYSMSYKVYAVSMSHLAAKYNEIFYTGIIK